MDKDQARESVRRFAQTIADSFHPRMVVLYGSFSRGTQHEGSDIDVAVVVDEIQGDLIDRETELYRIRRGIDDRIEPVLVQRNPDPSGFVEHILANGEVIYPD